ncbi:MAG: histidine kinase N-terminal 7TM domain-containing protein [Vicinamibacterales bacterium]|nr:histidine kinase N-terminal 7TM domain-containing protein [Vicinamibacterales bacterium]
MSVVTLIYLTSASISVVAGVAAWRRRDVRGARPLALMVAAAALWAACDAIEVNLATAEARRFVSQVQYLGVVSAAPFFFHMAMALARRERQLTPVVLTAVWAVPLISLLMAWTSAWHPWLWTRIEMPAANAPFAIYHYGAWFWVLAAQHYGLMALGTVLLVETARRVTRPFRRGMFVAAAAVGLIWFGNFVYIFKLGPYPGLNWAAASLGVSGALLAWVVLDEGLFDLLPRPDRDDLLDLMSDGVLIVDRAGRVLRANQSARVALHLPEALDVEVPPTLGLPPLKDDASAVWRSEVRIGHPAGRWLDVRATAVHDRWGDLAGRFIVIRDITIPKRLEEEREALITKLRAAVATVRTLEDLLPICANCRKVRDDRGYWGQIEDYLRTRAAVEFTHGICPECMDHLYGELGEHGKPDEDDQPEAS